jgi:hypothetical protein
MSRLQLKVWMAPLATLQAQLAEGEVGIVEETKVLVKRPDGDASGALIACGDAAGTIAALLGQPNGAASLDSAGKVLTAQLPSYVDSVIEVNNFAALPTTGAVSTIYVAKDNGKIYRWSGSRYIEITSTTGSTDTVAEGSTNLYFTVARAQAAVTSIAGNAGTATKLSSAKTIALSGDAAGSVAFDGSANATIAAVLANSGVTAGAYGSVASIPTITVDAKGRVTDVAVTTLTPAAIRAVDAALVGVANGIASLDAAGKVPAAHLPSYVDSIIEVASAAHLPPVGSAATIYVTIDTGKVYRFGSTSYVEVSATVGTTDGLVEGTHNLYFTAARAQAAVTSVSGNAGTATKLASAQNVALSGDVTGSAAFDGSTDVTITAALANSGVTAGSYGAADAIPVVTVDAKGRVTAVTNTAITPAAIGAIPASAIGTANGVASLDVNGQLPAAAIPSSASANLGQPGGAATLDSSGKILVAQLPSSVLQTALLGAASGIATLGSDGKLSASQVPASLQGANTSVSHVWSGQQTPTAQTLTDGDTVAIAITEQIWELTTSAARVIDAPTGGVAKTSYRMYLITDDFTPSWNSAFKFAGGVAPSGLSGTCVFDFYTPDGATFICTGQSVAVA